MSVSVVLAFWPNRSAGEIIASAMQRFIVISFPLNP